MRLALCGNPNVGKTTLFNRLTRSSEPVGNWHGVTVGAREKRIAGSGDVVLCDLPGAYSLTARSKEEEITRDGVLGDEFDVIVFVAEVNNLRRNLYLLTQVAEARKKAVLVVNMMDEARGKVDLDLISKRLGIPVIGASERGENPKSAILDAVVRAAVIRLPYIDDGEIAAVSRRIASAARTASLPPEYAALKILERDGFVMEELGADAAAHIGKCSECGACNVMDRPAELRYAFIDNVLKGAIEKKGAYARTDRIDKVILGKAALPIFFAIMSAVFVITFEAGKPLTALLSKLIDSISAAVRSSDMPEWVRAFLADGIIGGAGSVLAFLPQVTILFLLTALLQDSGYMSRVAFVTDGFFKRFGLSGRAAFSLILGLGCSATAVLSSRGIASESARRATAFVVPFVPCSARLSVFTAVTAYFGLPGISVAAMYILGFAAALLVLRMINYRRRVGGDETLLMEIPPYRIPSPKRVFKGVLKSVGSFIVRVGTVVLGVGAVMWILGNFSVAYGFTGGSEASIMCTVSGIIAPVFKPLGFGDWRAVTALISGVAAKETLISVIASLGGMSAVFGSKISAMSFLIFSCLYVPCIATLAAIGKENGGKSVALSVAVHTAAAYIASLVFYQSAVLFEHDLKLFCTIYACVAVVAGGIIIIGKVKREKSKSEKAKKFAD